MLSKNFSVLRVPGIGYGVVVKSGRREHMVAIYSTQAEAENMAETLDIQEGLKNSQPKLQKLLQD